MVSSFALIDCMIMQRTRAAWKACTFLCVPESVQDETSWRVVHKGGRERERGKDEKKPLEKYLRRTLYAARSQAGESSRYLRYPH